MFTCMSFVCWCFAMNIYVLFLFSIESIACISILVLTHYNGGESATKASHEKVDAGLRGTTEGAGGKRVRHAAGRERVRMAL